MALFSNTKLGITIQDNVLVCCEVTIARYRETTKVRALNAVELPPHLTKEGHITDRAKLKKILNTTLEKAYPTAIKSREVVFQVPEEFAFHHLFEFPTNIPSNQLNEAVILEAEKVLPFSIEQVSWDSRLLGTLDDKQLVLFSASQRAIVQDYYDFFLECGIQPLGFSIRIENLLQTLGSGKPEPTLILDLQKNTTNALFCVGKKLLGAQQISIGENQFKKNIKEHYGLSGAKFDEEMLKLSTVDISLANVHLMKLFEQELEATINIFENIWDRFSSDQERNHQKKKKTKKTPPKKGDKDKKDTNKVQSAEIMEQLEEEFGSSFGSDKTADASKGPEKAQRIEARSLFGSKRKMRFVFTGHSVLLDTMKQYFKENTDPRLKPLNGDLRQLIKIKGEDADFIRHFHLITEKPQKKKTPKKKAKKNRHQADHTDPP